MEKKVSLKIMNSGIILKTCTNVYIQNVKNLASLCRLGGMSAILTLSLKSGFLATRLWKMF